ncbi:MAG: uracil-DNA glycosylase [Eubacteriaceae bacterium]|nr:uracil-DNA glycosylase [Eubacteriaceae bacterium]
MAVKIGNDWDGILKGEFEKEYYLQLRKALLEEYKSYVVYPDMHSIFNALKMTGYSSVKVVILGQDPYHNPGQAHGLSFSVLPGTKPPPSLMNIYKELGSDLGISPPQGGDLTKWAAQGVLLLNSILTVRSNTPASHRHLGWETFTDRVITLLNEREAPVVFMLWGSYAQSKGRLVTQSQHLTIISPHPSPLSASRGFFGSKPFSRANQFLIEAGYSGIDWSL